MRRLTCVLIVVGVLAICCVGVIVLALLAAEAERSNLRETYGETVAAMCDPAAGGEPSQSNAPQGTPLAALVLNNGQVSRHTFHMSLPDDIRADDSAELDVVMCVSTREEEVEKCEYTATGANNESTTFTITRVQKIQDVVLLNATTGARIAEVSVPGSSPDQCPDTYRATEGSENKEKGADVTFNDFLTIVEPILRGQ